VTVLIKFRPRCVSVLYLKRRYTVVEGICLHPCLFPHQSFPSLIVPVAVGLKQFGQETETWRECKFDSLSI